MQPITITGSVTLAPITVGPAGPPDTYLGAADAMLSGVHVLAKASPLPALPLAMLSAHVLECILKAYLSRFGDGLNLKERDLRHNLNQLWGHARFLGLAISEQPPSWVDCLSQLHDFPYCLRYLTNVHGISTPPPEPMRTDLTNLIEQVRKQIRG